MSILSFFGANIVLTVQSSARIFAHEGCTSIVWNRHIPPLLSTHPLFLFFSSLVEPSLSPVIPGDGAATAARGISTRARVVCGMALANGTMRGYGHGWGGWSLLRRIFVGLCARESWLAALWRSGGHACCCITRMQPVVADADDAVACVAIDNSPESLFLTSRAADARGGAGAADCRPC